MNWKKKASGSARSISSETHGAHLSMKSEKDFTITVYRTKPDFENLGQAKTFKEAIQMCEDDANKKAASEGGLPTAMSEVNL